MRVAVLGAGVIGITSAYYLNRAGHEVVVIDRQPGAARETSFANAGEVSPGYASPWAGPGIPLKALRWLLMRHAPLILRPRPDAAMARWLVSMLGNCTSQRYEVNKSRMVRLAEFSRDQLEELRDTLALSYDQRTLGTLQLFRTQSQIDDAEKDIAILERYGVPYQSLNTDQCIDFEPGLRASRDLFSGGLRLPGDETGDCHLFTTKLAEYLAGKGVEFHYNTAIDTLHLAQGRLSHITSDQGRIDAECFVVALAAHSSALLQPLGIRLPVYPVKGYSITAAVADASFAPTSTILDESYKVAITRLGDRIRVGGMAEVSGYSHDLPEKRRSTLVHCLTELFPGGAHLNDLSFWSGLRPMTPDGPPIIGPTGIPNLFLNTGHGTLGWTMACGSGHLLASLISGATPAIEAGDLALSRYGAG